MTTNVEDRLRRLEDAEQIRDLLMAYGRTLDDRDMEAYSALFASDGEWLGPFVGAARGPAGILQLMRENLGPAPKGSHHLMTNMVVSSDGDRGTASSRWTYVVPAESGGPALAISGRYEDELVREDGHWRFRARRVSGDLAIPM